MGVDMRDVQESPEKANEKKFRNQPSARTEKHALSVLDLACVADEIHLCNGLRLKELEKDVRQKRYVNCNLCAVG